MIRHRTVQAHNICFRNTTRHGRFLLSVVDLLCDARLRIPDHSTILNTCNHTSCPRKTPWQEMNDGSQFYVSF